LRNFSAGFNNKFPFDRMPLLPPAARVVYSTLFFLLAMTLVLVSKPPPLFSPEGHVRPFGVGPHSTVYPLGVVTVVVAVLSMFIFTLIDVVYG
jgi:hypothetical protein